MKHVRIGILESTIKIIVQVRLRVRVISDCDVSFICIHRYESMMNKKGALDYPPPLHFFMPIRYVFKNNTETLVD